MLNKPIDIANISYIFNYARLVFSNIFPIIWFSVVILFIAHVLYIDSVVYLCESDTSVVLYNLKVTLINEVANYRISQAKVDCYTDLYHKLQEISRPNFRNFDLEAQYMRKLDIYRDIMRVTFHKVTDLENSIKAIQPEFKSPLQNLAYYPRFRG